MQVLEKMSTGFHNDETPLAKVWRDKDLRQDPSYALQLALHQPLDLIQIDIEKRFLVALAPGDFLDPIGLGDKFRGCRRIAFGDRQIATVQPKHLCGYDGDKVRIRWAKRVCISKKTQIFGGGENC